MAEKGKEVSTITGQKILRNLKEQDHLLDDILKKITKPKHIKPENLHSANTQSFQPISLGERIIKKMQQEGKTVTFDDIMRLLPKKPPGKADGGRIDKALPKRSRDI